MYEYTDSASDREAESFRALREDNLFDAAASVRLRELRTLDYLRERRTRGWKAANSQTNANNESVEFKQRSNAWREEEKKWGPGGRDARAS